MDERKNDRDAAQSEEHTEEERLLGELDRFLTHLRESYEGALSALELGLLPEYDTTDIIAEDTLQIHELHKKLTCALSLDEKPGATRTIQFLRESVEKHSSAVKKQSLIGHAKSVMDEFACLYSKVDRHEATLSELRKRIAAYTDDAICSIIDDERLSVYEDLISAVTEGITDDETETELAAEFGDVLVTALVRKTVYFASADELAEKSNPLADEVPAADESASAKRNSPACDLPAGDLPAASDAPAADGTPVDDEPAVMGEPLPMGEEPATIAPQTQAGPNPADADEADVAPTTNELPEPDPEQTEPSEDYDEDDEDFFDDLLPIDLAGFGITLPEDSVYGVLHKHVASKTPRGVKAFINDVLKKPTGLIGGLRLVIWSIFRNRTLSSDELGFTDDDETISSNISYAVSYLEKEGYIARYTLSTDENTQLYCLTDAGERVLASESARSFFSNNVKPNPYGSIVTSGADFIRLARVNDLRRKHMQNRYDTVDVPEAVASGKPGLQFYTDQINTTSFCHTETYDGIITVHVPCFFSSGEEDQLDPLLDAVMDLCFQNTDDISIFIIAETPELEEAWCKVFRSELAGTVDPDNIYSSKSTDGLTGAHISGEEAIPAARTVGKASEAPAERHDKPVPTETKSKKSRKKETSAVDDTPAQAAVIPSGSRKMAELLLERSADNAPEPVDAAMLMLSLAEDSSWADLLALAQALSYLENPVYINLRRRFEYMLDVPHDTQRYTSESLNLLDKDLTELSGVVPDAFLLRSSWAALTLTCFAPASEYDMPLIVRLKQSISDMERDGNLSAIRNVLTQLDNMLEDHPSGFSRRILQQLLTNEDRVSRLSDIRKIAGNLLSPPNFDVRMEGAGRLKDKLFGKHSEVGKSLAMIAAGDDAGRAEILEFYTRFRNVRPEIPAFDRSRIEGYIDEKWLEVKGKQSVRKIAHDLFDKASNNLERRFDVIGEWLDLSSTGVENPESLSRHAELLISALDAAIAETDASGGGASERASNALLRQTFTVMKQRLTGTDGRSKNLFLSILGAPYIGLNESGQPVFYPELNTLHGFEPWRLALKNASYEKLSFTKVLENTDDAKQPLWFSNYGTSEYLQKYLTTDRKLIVDYAPSIRYAKKDSDTAVRTLRSHIDLSYLNGCIEEQTKEAADALINDFSDEIAETHDFARLHMFICAIYDRIERDKKVITQSLRERLEALRGTSEESAVQVTERALDKGLLSAAEDYINRIETRDFSFADEAQTTFDTNAMLESFNAVYEDLYNVCKRNSDRSIYSWAYNYLEQNSEKLLTETWTERNKRSSQTFINNWISSAKPRQGQRERVEQLLKCIFITLIKTVEVKSIGNVELYEGTMLRAPKNQADYSHPISLFGTALPGKLKIAALYGVSSAEQIFSRVVTELRIDGDAIVLVDAALSAGERRELARRLKPRMSGVIIVLDRVLMLYLASRYDTERLKTLLACSLPYTYCLPYSNDGAPASDEMFMGRKAELSDIRSMTGACLVYGGRQLGKTSLLSRACSIEHNPAQQEYALFIPIENMSAEAFTGKLAERLVSEGVLPELGVNPSIDGICAALNGRFKENAVKKLLLALDEADCLLEEEGRSGYKVLHQFVNLRQLTANRFKCVFAGLHNVLRTKNAFSDNSPLAKLGKPLCVKPLRQSDAQMLVQYPLGYLGYKISDEQLATILSVTNFYPGIIHLFCYELIKNIAENHNTHYQNGDPPFFVDSKVLGSVISSANLNERVREKIHMTLHQDDRYWRLAIVAAYICYEKSGRNEFLTVAEIRDEAKNLTGLSSYDKDGINTLLDELCEMGILFSSSEQEHIKYRFRMNKFLKMMGSEDDVENLLLEEMCQ